MGKKIFCSLVSLIMIMSLVACGNNDSVITDSTPVQAAPAVTEKPAPEPEPEPEVVTEEVVEEPTPEPTEEPTPEPAEPTEEEIVAEVLANDEYYEDGAFCPKLYAEALGYKWWGDFDDEVDFSTVIDGIEYFILCHGATEGSEVIYTDGEKCYETAVIDNEKDDRTDVIKVKTADVINDNSAVYAGAIVTQLYRLSIGDTNIKSWEYDGVSYAYVQFDSKPVYFSDGFIDATELANKNEEESSMVLYNQ